jgi:hypothetical protein
MIAVFGFFGGATILTSLSFHAVQKIRPTASEAVGAHKAWTEKMLAITLAVVSASLIACLAQTVLGLIVWPDFKSDHVFEPVLLLIVIVCSTGFWTLLARSVIADRQLFTSALPDYGHHWRPAADAAATAVFRCQRPGS